MNEEFYGRRINSGKNSYRFELCEVCLIKSCNWIEIIGSNEEGYSFRLTCDNCHLEFDKIPIIDELYSREVEDEIEIEKTVRSGWVDDFINNNEDNIEKIANLDDKIETNERKNSNWTKDFIDEALFGTDPIQWIKSKGLIEDNNVEDTITIFNDLSTNDISAVKLAAIQCLFSISNEYKNLNPKIINALQSFSVDVNDIVAQYSLDIINKIR